MASERTKGGTFSSYLPGWSNLPGGLLSLILDKLFELVDCVRFAVVCKEWCSLANHYYHTTQRWRPNKVLPMLMFPSGFKEVHNTKTRRKILQSSSLYSISERKVYIKNLESPVLPYGTNRLLGGGHGWLATLDEHRSVMALVNPFRKSVAPIFLPPLEIGDRIKKVILSGDPALDRKKCLVVAKFNNGRRLAFLKLREEKDQITQHWSHIPMFFNPSDIMFYKSRLYLCHPDGSIWLIDDASDSFRASGPYAPLPDSEFTNLGVSIRDSIHSYLVESTRGDLWHVLRFISNNTQSFKVFKVELIETGRNLRLQQVDVNSIGDEALFVGYNSISVLASEIPGCQPNTICHQSDHVMSMFNLDAETSATDYHIIQLCEPMFWVTPPFNSASLSLSA